MGDPSNINTVTNDLLLKYDEKFNELYNKKVHIDSSIMNKEELIMKENDEIQNKEINVTMLQYSVIFIILFGVLLILNALNKLLITQVIIFTIILFFIYLFLIYFTVYRKVSAYQVDKVIKNIKVDMKDYVNSVIGNNVDPYKCPTTCTNSSTNPPPSSLIQGYQQPTLNIDPQVNVWRYGDIPVDLYTSKNTPGSDFYANPRNIPNYRNTLEEDIEDEPRPNFGTTYPRSTYYKCEWLGGNNTGLPNNEPVTYSSIPCSYRENYEETGRYICSKNPNNLSSTEFNTVCNDVSYH
jgi:hypothetical protein